MMSGVKHYNKGRFILCLVLQRLENRSYETKMLLEQGELIMSSFLLE